MSSIDKQITFIQHDEPPLKAGSYKVSVTHEVKIREELVENSPFVSEYKLEVKGNRYQLDEGAVYAVYPPVESEGDYSAHLPHIVLNKTTLPWERRIDDETTPWLALLLFDEADPIPQSQNIAISELREGLPERVFHPVDDDIQVYEYSEEQKDRCTVIDVPLAIFNAIVPSAADLSYLAHIRKVGKKDKVLDLKAHGAFGRGGIGLLAEDPAEGEYAVIIGNRLPSRPKPAADDADALGINNMVHLVSLEGFGNCLPNDKGSSSIDSEKFSRVRLVSLKSWSFTTKPQLHRLTDILCKLDKFPSHLQVPEIKGVVADSPQDEVNTILARGYVGLNHHTRRNDRTVSWYRGPLLPYDFPFSGELNPPEVHPDAALHYDLQTGMFDVSYAAAWQLGKLLALHDMSFATALLRWRQQKIRQTQAAFQRQQTLREFGLTPSDQLLAEASDIDPLTVTAIESLATQLTNFLDSLDNEA